MKSSRRIAVSLCVNVLLAGVVIWTSRNMLPRTATGGGSQQGANHGLLLGTRDATLDTPSSNTPHSSPSPIVVDAPFRWPQLESPDYRLYVRNLRGVGCPEATIRDIIIADVNEVFCQRVKELVETVQNRFWEMLADRNEFEKMVDDKHKELDDLEKERDNILKELLGPRADHRLRREELAQIERI